jgi:hypothetical protein
MDDKALSGLFAAKDTFSHRGSDSFPAQKRIAFSNLTDYSIYTLEVQHTDFGKVRDKDNYVVVQVNGPLVPHLAQAMNVARQKYNLFGSDFENVWNVVTVAGWLPEPISSSQYGDPNGYKGIWAIFPTSPEMITAQAWLTLNCGADGIVWQDPTWDGANVGILDWRSGDHSIEYADSLQPNHPSLVGQAKWTLPKMWYGFKSRFEAVRRIGVTFRDTVLKVYDHLQRPGFQMSVHDSLSRFSDIPMVDTLISQRAVRYDSTSFVYSDTNDARSESFIELTVFRPKAYIDTGMWKNSLYMLITNRRTWPIDFLKYGTRTTAYGSDSLGFGNIDVRRPMVRLRNATTVVADSFRIQRIGSDTSYVYAYNTDIVLDWLTPGWGAMYRVTPIPSGISQRGVAWNNAVHAENIGCSIPNAPTVVVYERDSVIYVRKFQSGAWSSEVRLSDASDTSNAVSPDTVYIRRGYNYFPAIASVRNPNVFLPDQPIQSMLAVWEHQDFQGNHSVQGCRIANIFDDWGVVPDSLLRYNFSLPISMTSGMNHTPSVTGVIDGYLVSWGRPKYGISVLAVRDNYVNLRGFPDFRDTMGIHGIWSKFPLDSISQDSVTRYPTLASVPLWRLLFLNDTVVTRNGSSAWYNGEKEGNQWNLTSAPPSYAAFWIANLAYQQGPSSEFGGQQIVHHQIGVQFVPDAPATAPIIRLAVMKPEHVSIKLPECNFLHPSIAVDSVRVGVAFEAIGESRRTITLRFRDVRDSLGIWVPLASGRKPFLTPAYRWGDYHIIKNRFFSEAYMNTYTRPSVTQFPTLDSLQLVTTTRGALTWQWTNAPNSAANGLLLYRYGAATAVRIADGQDASMIFAPFIAGNATTIYDATGVLRRGAEGSKFQRKRPFRDTLSHWYFPLNVDSVYPRNNALLSTGQSGHIYSYLAAIPRNIASVYLACRVDDVHFGILTGIPPKPNGDPDHPTDSVINGLSPKFFGIPINGNTWATTIPEVAEVARTSVFEAPDTSVTLDVRVIGNDSVVSWLNTQPFDSTLMHPADMGAVVELIKASDSSVLWRSDTLWARTADDSVLIEPIVIPVDSVVSSGTWVFARLRPFVTENLDVDFSAGFFFPDSTVESVAPKRVTQYRTSSGAMQEKLSVSIVPNPATGSSADIVVSVWEQGSITVSIYDAKGEKVMDVDRFQPEAAGEYVAPIDLQGFRNGVYIVVVQQGIHRASTTMPIVR